MSDSVTKWYEMQEDAAHAKEMARKLAKKDNMLIRFFKWLRIIKQ